MIIQWETKNAPKILTQIAEELLDSRLYVIKATLLERKKKIHGRHAKKNEAASTEHFDCFFFSRSLLKLWLDSDSQVYSLRILLVSDAALCICSGEDSAAAAINYSERTPMPQSLPGRLPGGHQHFYPSSFSHIQSYKNSQKASSQLFYTLVSIFLHFE